MRMVGSLIQLRSYPPVQSMDNLATIVAVCSGTATLCWDLEDPFSGSFSIEGTGAQLADLRVCFREDIREALAESNEVPSTTRNL